MKAFVAALLFFLSACVFFEKPQAIIPTQLISTSPSQRLVIVLPGRGDKLAGLATSGIVDAIQRASPDTDVLLVEMTLAYYMEGHAVQRLHDEVLLPAGKKYREIYLAGASMGGMGAMMYQREHAGALSGLILMAPYTGDPSLMKEIKAAGGLKHWSAGAVPEKLSPGNASREQWRVAQSWLNNPEQAKRVWLICGDGDRFYPAAEMLAEAIPKANFIPIAGGHKWTVWSQGMEKAFASMR